MGLPGIIIRINPKECDYDRLDSKGDLFSSAANTNFLRAGVAEGTYLFAIASGANKDQGILGVWRLTASPFKDVMQAQDCYHEPHRTTRRRYQTRFPARCQYHVRQPNLQALQPQFSQKLKQTTPVLLRTMADVNALLQIAHMYR
jgi:hypothetical protein